jgi:hypothetical protein
MPINIIKNIGAWKINHSVLYAYKELPIFSSIYSGKYSASLKLRNSEVSVCMVKYVCMFIQINPFEIQTKSAAAYVIAQQYSSANFVSLRFRSPKEYFGACLKATLFQFLHFSKMA